MAKIASIGNQGFGCSADDLRRLSGASQESLLCEVESRMEVMADRFDQSPEVSLFAAKLYLQLVKRKKELEKETSNG
jgi:hypothetical protein